MKKTRSKKSRDTVPLNRFTENRLHIVEGERVSIDQRVTSTVPNQTRTEEAPWIRVLLLCTTHEPGSILHWTQVHITEAVAVALAVVVALALAVALAVASHITCSSFLRVTST